jgi:glycosyltransferase involved in cell wall biosynthesis
LLVQPRDAEALAGAMIQMIERPDSEIQAMADASLEIARAKYDVNRVNRQMLEIMGL